MKNFFFLVLVFSFLQGAGAAVNEASPFWYKLERGKQLYRAGNYGEALLLFENARDDRARFYEDCRASVLALLSQPEVRALDDNLPRILDFAAQRYYTQALSAFDELFFYVSDSALGGRASSSLDLFDSLKPYPEAEFWIGEVYRIEGAASIAVKQYEKALVHRAQMEDAALETEILYKLAALHKNSGNYNEMERNLIQILEVDPLWARDASSFTKNAIQKTLDNDGIDRVLLMYRYKSVAAEKAHRLLGEYYYQSGRHQRAAEHYLFAWLSSSAVIIESYQSKLIDPFEFKTMAEITRNLSRRPDISSYMNDADYYKTCYYFGAALYGAGKESAARSLFSFLSAETAAGEWRSRAQRQLRSPFVEEAVFR